MKQLQEGYYIDMGGYSSQIVELTNKFIILKDNNLLYGECRIYPRKDIERHIESGKLLVLSDDKLYLFVYGTLKKGESLHDLLEGAIYLGDDTVKGKLYTNGSYPYMFKGNKNVPGEVYEVTPNIYLPIHRIEHGSGYIAEKVKTAKGKQVLAFYAKDTINKEYLEEIDVF